MKVGIVSKWTASGQAVVARQIRSALDELGHETFVLARPGSGPRAQQAAEGERDPVWDQPGVTEGSTHEMAVEEYQRWAKENRLEAVLCDENYQWEAIRSLRESGIQTIGRFVWEYFAAEHVAPAREAYDTIYSLTKAEQQRYGKLGIESPYVQWGIHPELLEIPPGRSSAGASGLPGPLGATEREDMNREGVGVAGNVVHDFPSRSCAPTGETGGAAEDLVGGIYLYHRPPWPT